jgi:acyl-homoserine lactone acylase PvdQ
VPGTVRRPPTLLLCALTAATLAVAAPAAAAPEPGPYQANDGLGFRNVLPPGNNGLANGFDLIQFEASKAHPAHNDDQLSLYGDLVYKAPELTNADLDHFFKDASFGVRPDDVADTYSPRDDVTIVRDKSFGTPHIYGSTRAGTMFGAGYVAAEDRLFFIDVLRHLGRGQLASFAGGTDGNRATDASQWAIAPYTEDDLQKQVDQLPKLFGKEGQTVLDDVNAYVEGVNKYIQEARLNPSKMPGEYPAINQPQGPDDWNARDIIATASLVGGIFGKGGGGEVESALVLQAAQKQLGKRKGRRAWHDFRSLNDPEAPTTAVGKRFPYEIPPKKPARGSVAMPDPGSVKFLSVRSSGGSADRPGAAAALRGGTNCKAGALVCFPKSASNALVVSGRESQSGHPLAVFGPQTGYFSPQILMEQDMHGPGLEARGAAFPGVNLYVELGRGRDYAWSATSAGQDNVDTFALPLCNPDGSAPTLESSHYLYRGTCRQIETLDRTVSWTPSAADQTPPGTETYHAERTALGLVIARATIKGKPVIYTSLRTTYMHEVDSALGFSDFNDPARMTGPEDFKRAAYKIGYTFNWLYVDDKHDAYFNSGNNPVRGRKTDPNFPVWGTPKFEWRGFDPAGLTARYTPFEQHPQAVDQRFLTSWNNKQAPGYAASDNKWSYNPTFRSELLDTRIRRNIAGARKTTLAELAGAMEDAGTADLRGDQNLPWALRVLGKQKDPALAGALAKLRTWMKNGSHRRDKNHDGAYDESEAVRIMDAWWPRWVRAQFEPVIGKDAYERISGINEPDNAPNNHGDHLGSAYDDGWYGYINKDLRTIVKPRKVKGRYSRVYCGGTPKRSGNRKRCRALLASTLAQALKMTPEQIYTGDPLCKDGDQWCFDAVRQRPLGAITQPLIHWINRPTFQQVVEIQRRAR